MLGRAPVRLIAADQSDGHGRVQQLAGKSDLDAIGGLLIFEKRVTLMLDIGRFNAEGDAIAAPVAARVGERSRRQRQPHAFHRTLVNTPSRSLRAGPPSRR